MTQHQGKSPLQLSGFYGPCMALEWDTETTMEGRTSPHLSGEIPLGSESMRFAIQVIAEVRNMRFCKCFITSLPTEKPVHSPEHDIALTKTVSTATPSQPISALTVSSKVPLVILAGILVAFGPHATLWGE